jgi:hypothetical protein
MGNGRRCGPGAGPTLTAFTVRAARPAVPLRADVPAAARAVARRAQSAAPPGWGSPAQRHTVRMNASAPAAAQSSQPVAMAHPVAAAALLETLRHLVVKDGVSLGGLADGERELALALVWAGLPQAVLRETEVNAALKAALAGPAAWLATDHVELRRWLADAGWLQRDAFGHAYRRADVTALLPIRQEAAAAVAGLDAADFVRRSRAAHAAERLARRQAWLSQGGQPERAGQPRPASRRRDAPARSPGPAGA